MSRDPSPPASAAPQGGLLTALALIAVGVALTTSLVWLVRVRSQAVEAGYRIHALRMQLVQLEQQRAALEVERATLARPTRLAIFARTDLGLVPPDLSAAVSSTATTSTTARQP
jgi:cell division protein FtsL